MSVRYTPALEQNNNNNELYVYTVLKKMTGSMVSACEPRD